MFYVHQIILIYQLLQFGFAQFAAAVDRLLAIGWVGGGRARRQGSHYMILFFFRNIILSGLDTNKFVSNAQSLRIGASFHIFFMGDGALLLRNWYEIIALYNIKSVLTDFSASRPDKKNCKKTQ